MSFSEFKIWRTDMKTPISCMAMSSVVCLLSLCFSASAFSQNELPSNVIASPFINETLNPPAYYDFTIIPSISRRIYYVLTEKGCSQSDLITVQAFDNKETGGWSWISSSLNEFNPYDITTVGDTLIGVQVQDGLTLSVSCEISIAIYDSEKRLVKNGPVLKAHNTLANYMAITVLAAVAF
jgi:hypothetical protein